MNAIIFASHGPANVAALGVLVTGQVEISWDGVKRSWYAGPAGEVAALHGAPEVEGVVHRFVDVHVEAIDASIWW